jgi:hypothetical protein
MQPGAESAIFRVEILKSPIQTILQSLKEKEKRLQGQAENRGRIPNLSHH